MAGVVDVGSPMWADRRWVGTLFPADTRSGEELRPYATWCTAVEGNTTFYALPDEAAVERWREQTPPSFRFCFKVPRAISHDRRLRNAQDELSTFMRRLAPLGSRLGPAWIQLPPSFDDDDLPALDAFLSTLSTDWSWGVEVRNRAFEADGVAERRLNDLLHRHGVERVLIDTRAVFAGPRVTPAEIEAFERKPRLKVRPVALGPTPVVRFIGQTDHAANPPFWEPWVAKVAQWVDEGRRPIVFIHTPDNARAPEHAREFHDAVAAVVDLDPLPAPSRAEHQPDLFGDD
ncbi:MAG: DUF72 domain-containing protein [Actinomycetota bacterium]